MRGGGVHPKVAHLSADRERGNEGGKERQTD